MSMNLHLDLPPTKNYEFDANQNSTISALAAAMKFVAIVEILLGVLYGVLTVFALMQGALGTALGYGVTSVITLVLASMTSVVAGHFRSVVATEGADIIHLMGALDELRKYFSLKRVLYIIAMVLIGVAIVFVFLFSMRGSSSI